MSRPRRASSLAARSALAAIRGYQRWISPHKGFCCTLRVVTGAESCSTYGLRVIARFGLLRGLALVRRRLDLCGYAHGTLPCPPAPPVPPWRRSQQGFCDLSCDAPACDLPSCDMPSCHGGLGDTFGDCACDLLDCSDGLNCDPFGWWRKRRAQRQRDRQRDLAALARRVRERDQLLRRQRTTAPPEARRSAPDPATPAAESSPAAED